VLPNRQVSQVVANSTGIDVRGSQLLPFGGVAEEAFGPADVRAFRPVGVMAGAQLGPELLECRQSVDPAPFVDDAP
jgi:hypothetical protein